MKSNTRNIFEQSLLRPDVVEYYNSIDRAELEKTFSPSVSRLVGFEQDNPHHCYDLWNHTLHTVKGIPEDKLDDEDIVKLKVAAFFHDVGKPEVYAINPNTGRHSFHGHTAKSVIISRPILEKLGYSSEEIPELLFYIGHHDDLMNYHEFKAPENHVSLRKTSIESFAEKIIENSFDFRQMGYDEKQIRYICYFLAHNGKKPDFKNENISVNMDEVIEKIASGNYPANFSATLKNYRNLTQLCLADTSAQADKVYIRGKLQTTKTEKLNNIYAVERILDKAYEHASNSIDSVLLSYQISKAESEKSSLSHKLGKASDLFKEFKKQCVISKKQEEI